MVDPAVIHDAAQSASPFYPYASWHPLPENDTQPIITPVQLILHTEASSGKASNQASWNYWARTDVVSEAHFLLDMTGDMWQCMATNRRADNNIKANVRAISIETQDLGGATVNATPWTEEQLEQLAGLAAWCHLRWGIPLHPCPTWDQPGVSPHNAYPSQWSSSAHSCPGKARTAQMGDVLARAQAIVDWKPTPAPKPIPPSEEDDMPRYIAITAPGRNPALVAFGDAGCNVIGLDGDAIRDLLPQYGVPGVTNVSPELWDDFCKAHKGPVSK